VQLARLIFHTKPFAMTGEKLRKYGGFARTLGPLARYGITDIIDLDALSPNGRGVMIGAPLIGSARSTRAEYAILPPDARLEYGAGDAKSELDRTALRGAAEALDRARGTRRRQDPEEALGLWRALVSGRWTLFDHYESDGRRVLIARRNGPETAARSNLSRRTLQVLEYRAMGHSLKFISYELGLSTSTVHRELKRGMAALGVGSPVELARLEWKDKPVPKPDLCARRQPSQR
jgi:DNA-binding CsgD family transcriptional regulator